MITTWILVSLLTIAGCIIATNTWISIYNKLQYWYTRAQRHFADVAIVVQQRFDNINALAQIAQQYKVHEYQTLKTVIEARSRWTTDAELNANIKTASEMEYNYSKLQAIFEKYPDIKASQHYATLMEQDTKIEAQLKQSRVSFNYDAQRYNEITRRFPHNIIAGFHNFRELYYLILPPKSYEPSKLFNSNV